MRRAPILSCLLWTVTVTGCGDDGIRRLGDAGIPATELAIDTIVIDDGECGAQPAAKSLTFTNSGTGPLTWSASIEGAGFTLVGEASGTVDPEGSATITVQPDAVPSSASVGQMIEAMLVVETNARTEPFAIPLSLQVHGGSLLVETPAGVDTNRSRVPSRSDVKATVPAATPNASGVVLIEVYDVTQGGPAGPKAANVSTRGLVGTGGNQLIAGGSFYLAGGASARWVGSASH